jgi:hypothetical protein
MPDEGTPRRYRRARRESDQERAAKFAEWRVVADLVDRGAVERPDLARMLQRALRQRDQDAAENVPVLVEEDETAGPAGWRSATEYACRACLSRFVWRRRPERVEMCPVCEAAVTESPPPVVERPPLERVREVPEDAVEVPPPAPRTPVPSPPTVRDNGASEALGYCHECGGRGCFRCDREPKGQWWRRNGTWW